MTARIVVTTAQRGEPTWLVEDLRTNVAWADDFVLVDNTGQTGGWAHEGELRAKQRALCAKAGADWILFLDPDERLDDKAPDLIREAIKHNWRPAVFGFPLREMWTPDAYRCDGTWAQKKPRRRLVPFKPEYQWPDKPIHCGLAPANVAGLRRVTLDVWLYHLKNIEPGNRLARAAAYLAADPDFKHQRTQDRDWSWLYDETGLQLETIPAGRGFTPAYTRPYHFTPPG
jgi:hypothetical protein